MVTPKPFFGGLQISQMSARFNPQWLPGFSWLNPTSSTLHSLQPWKAMTVQLQNLPSRSLNHFLFLSGSCITWCSQYRYVLDHIPSDVTQKPSRKDAYSLFFHCYWFYFILFLTFWQILFLCLFGNSYLTLLDNHFAVEDWGRWSVSMEGKDSPVGHRAHISRKCGHGADEPTIGLDDLSGHFQPLWFNDFMKWHWIKSRNEMLRGKGNRLRTTCYCTYAKWLLHSIKITFWLLTEQSPKGLIATL